MTSPTDELVRILPRERLHPDSGNRRVFPEWLVTNGLGGYASGTVSGIITRRYHGLLIAALPAPLGRVVMLTHVAELIRLPDGTRAWLGPADLLAHRTGPHETAELDDFRLEWGLPVWTYLFRGVAIERRIMMPHRQNTVHVSYALKAGAGRVRLKLRPMMNFRPHESPVNARLAEQYTVTAFGRRYEVRGDPDLPALKSTLVGPSAAFTIEELTFEDVVYQTEERRGYEYQGDLWSPGYYRVDLTPDGAGVLVASTEHWDVVQALSVGEVWRAEHERRTRLVALAPEAAQRGAAAELVLAADQFLISPVGRTHDAARAQAAGEELRSVIAGYHWFTDWGRDTMIGLEGLTLSTGRHAEACHILGTFAHYVRDGLLPNMFPEGDHEGLYHTADATLWFFHAIRRYEQVTGDEAFCRLLLPGLAGIVRHHQAGTRFGIGVDARDGLLRQGAEGYQLTWMDAKVGDWVVTPRRGKAVEINALWYNALRLIEDWTHRFEGPAEARPYAEAAQRTFESFNRRFWYQQGGYLYDVVDGENGDDPACRPNQVFAISLEHPVLRRDAWEPVLEKVRDWLLTPVGLRSLSPDHPDFKATYTGDLRARDAAYHQGTVWAWLIGPYIDAWMKTFPDDRQRSRDLLAGFLTHLGEAGIGTISEVFDAQAPYTPRGCIAQAWSVAEVLRCWIKTE